MSAACAHRPKPTPNPYFHSPKYNSVGGQGFEFSLSELMMKTCMKAPCATTGAYNTTIDETTMVVRLSFNNSIEFDVYRSVDLH